MAIKHFLKKSGYALKVIQLKSSGRLDLKEFRKKIEEATRKAFMEIHEAHKDETLYAFGLCSDQGMATIFPVANTTDFLLKKDEEDITYCKFDPAEWDSEIDGAAQEFDQICTTLRTLDREREGSEERFAMWKRVIHENCIRTLEKLRNERFFEEISGGDIFLTFSLTNERLGNKKQIETISRLNTDNYKAEYLKWLEGL